MNKYPEGIVKAAEELIEKQWGIYGHTATSYAQAKDGRMGTFIWAIKAAIVSCEFAINGFSIVNKGLDEVYQDIRTPKGISRFTEPYRHSLEQIKSYLEELKK